MNQQKDLNNLINFSLHLLKRLSEGRISEARLFLIKYRDSAEDATPQMNFNLNLIPFLNCLIECVNLLSNPSTQPQSLVFPHESLLLSNADDERAWDFKSKVGNLLQDLYAWRIKTHFMNVRQCYTSISVESLLRGFGSIKTSQGIVSPSMMSHSQSAGFPLSEEQLKKGLERYLPDEVEEWRVQDGMVYPPPARLIVDFDVDADQMQLDDLRASQKALKDFDQLAALSLSLALK